MAQLSITRNGRLEGVFYLPDRPVVIGRADGVDIQLLDSRVSRRHSVIRQSVAGFMIQDLNTKNGTFVNQETIEKSLLFHGDTIVVGGYSLHFLEEDDLESLDTEDISIIKDTDKLRVPQALADGASPRKKTDARGPSTAPGRTLRSPEKKRPARPARPARKAAHKAEPLRRSQSITQVPVIEGLSAEDLEAPREESYSEIEIIIDDESI